MRISDSKCAATKRHDFIKLPFDLLPAHAKNGPIEENVLAAGKFGMEARPHLEQTRHPSLKSHPAFRWFGDPAQDLQQGAFASSVSADDPNHLTLFNLEGDIFERPEFLFLLSLLFPAGSQPCERSARRFLDDMAQAIIFGTLMANDVAFAEVFDGDDGIRHIRGQRSETRNEPGFLIMLPSIVPIS